MDRLTYWNTDCGCWSYHCASGCTAGRLAEYENTGLTPQEVERLKSELSAYKKAESDGAFRFAKMSQKDHKDLGKYRELESAGLMAVLPCKVGSVVYEANIARNIVSKYKVTSVVIMTNSRNYGWELLDGIYSNVNGFNEFALGKTVFLTREDAEIVLKGEKHDA